MPVMCSGPGIFVPGGAPQNPARNRVGTSVVRHPDLSVSTDVGGLVFTDGWVDGITSPGLKGGAMSCTKLRIQFGHCHAWNASYVSVVR